VFLVSGILWLLIAWVILRGNQTSIAAVGILLGVVFLLSAINEAGLAALAPDGQDRVTKDQRPGEPASIRPLPPQSTAGNPDAEQDGPGKRGDEPADQRHNPHDRLLVR
jgi:hypothetical protein